MKYNVNNKPLECIMKNSTCYNGAGNGTPIGVLWHDTGAGNPNIKRYVQPHKSDANYDELIKKIGDNYYDNDWNHVRVEAGVNAWIGKLADGTVSTVQTLPWNHRPWGCGRGKNGSCNGVDGGKFWIQFEICDDSYKSKEYFDKIYKEACELTAYLCDKYNINPNGTVQYNGVTVPTILCHADSYKLGLGSNHGDVLQWFNKYGKDMNVVRKDVAAIMNKNNSNTPKTDVVEMYRVRKSWDDSRSQIGAFKSLSNAKTACDKAGNNYKVFNSDGKVVYPVGQFSPYIVKVTTDVLRIRKGPGTNYDMVGKIAKRDNGAYTIVDESSGTGATKWGLLKAYKDNRNGWISLDYVKRI